MNNENLQKELMMAARFIRGYQNRPRGQQMILKALRDSEAASQQEIQQLMNVAPGTVSEMISKLENKGLVERKRNEADRRLVEINLTEKGRKKAVEIYDKHKKLTAFLQKVAGVSEKIAEADACRIEHIISVSTFRGIKNYMKSNP